MSSLPPALDFPAMEEEIGRQWKEQDAFRRQDELSLERGDPVRFFVAVVHFPFFSSVGVRLEFRRKRPLEGYESKCSKTVLCRLLIKHVSNRYVSPRWLSLTPTRRILPLIL
jgi:hypothetical protein